MNVVTDKDFSKRTSTFYDDREGDTVTSLTSTKIIKVCEGPAPKAVFFLVPQVVKEQDVDNLPVINLEIISYANLSELSQGLRDQVRAELGLKK